MGLIFMKLLFCTLGKHGLSFIRGALTTHVEVVNDCIKMYVCMSCLLSVVLEMGRLVSVNRCNNTFMLLN